jgi:hypothetical protein
VSNRVATTGAAVFFIDEAVKSRSVSMEGAI